jgi:hypothetical protein
MQRWHARIDFYTPSKGLRHWEGEVEAVDAPDADQRACRAFRLTRPRLHVPKIVGVRLLRIERTPAT